MSGDTLFDVDWSEVVADNGGRVHKNGTATEKAAARTVKAGTQRARVLLALCDAPDGLNGYECAVRCGIARIHTATTRCEELEHLNLVRRTGKTRPTDTGCEALIFEATDQGRAVAADLVRSAA